MGRKREKRPYDRFAEYLDYKYARDHNRRPFYELYVGRGHTYVIREDGLIYITYHGTTIVCLAPNGDITLSSGGWRTLTTKTRINAILPRNWHVYSDMGVWYLQDPWKRKRIFADGMTIKYRGKKVLGEGQPISPKDLKHLKMKILRYATEYTRRLCDYAMGPPENTECPYCRERLYQDFGAAPATSLDLLIRPKGAGRPKGDVFGSIDHIEKHISEGEYPSSMIINAAHAFGCSPAAHSLLTERMMPSHPCTLSGGTLDVAVRQVQRVLVRYLRRRYGMGA